MSYQITYSCTNPEHKVNVKLLKMYPQRIDGFINTIEKEIEIPNSIFRRILRLKPKTQKVDEVVKESEYFCAKCEKKIKIEEDLEVSCDNCKTANSILEENKTCGKCKIGTIIKIGEPIWFTDKKY
jgi:hypothetical protein